jgi:hypothetical protein
MAESAAIAVATHPFRATYLAIHADPSPALELDLDQPRFLAPPTSGRVINGGGLAVGNRLRQ